MQYVTEMEELLTKLFGAVKPKEKSILYIDRVLIQKLFFPHEALFDGHLSANKHMAMIALTQS